MSAIDINRPILYLSICAVLSACATSPPVRDSADQTRHVGTVVRIGVVPTVNTSSDFQRSHMTSMFGLLGSVTTEVLGTQRGHTVYRIKVKEELELAVASRDEFAVGDCVDVWYPAAIGSRHYFGLGEAGIARSSGCIASDRR